MGALLTLAIVAIFVGYVSRERLFWVADNDPVVTKILENAHITNDLWFPLYRKKKNKIDARYRLLIAVYFWSSLAAIFFLLAAFAVHWLAA